MTAQWGQSVVVENPPGASSAIGNAAVAHARGDGCTRLLGDDIATYRRVIATADVKLN